MKDAPFVTPGRVRRLNAEAVIRLVEDAYGYTQGTLLRRHQARRFVHPRQVAIFLLAEQGMSYCAIGRLFNNRHHSTMLHARKKVAAAAQHDRQVFKLLEELRSVMATDTERFTIKPPEFRSLIRSRAVPAFLVPDAPQARPQ